MLYSGITKVLLITYYYPHIEFGHLTQFANQRRFATVKQTLSCVNLTSARGESRAIEVVLFYFIIPAIGHILPCTYTGQSVSST